MSSQSWPNSKFPTFLPGIRKMTTFTSRFPRISYILFTLLLALLSSNVNSQPTTTVDERATLLNLKQQWGNPPSLQHWNATSSLCNWPEIHCDGSGSVDVLDLRSKNISTPVPPSICDLPNLQDVNLAYNFIPGEFPTVFYNCSKLLKLDVSQNLFVGALPADIDRLFTINYLDVTANNFTGDIPPAIGRLSELSTLYLMQNLFNGTFPVEIGNLSNLQTLGMAYNGLSPAAIPLEFANLTKLEYLWMTQTNLIGEIPERFSELPNLEELDLSYNNLQGQIPPGLFLLRNLSILILLKNHFSNSIPEVIQSVNLTQIDFSMNNLTGSIPADFGKLQKLESLNLFSNKLSGEIPSTLAQIPALKNFRVFRNKLTGEIPAEFGLRSKLESFEVSENELTGMLPENLCSGGVLTGIIAFGNNLTGEMPQSLGNCNSLHSLQLYGNNFSGTVPSGVWTLINLTSLMLSDNSFSGELPSKVSWNLSRVEISNNKFSGRVPIGISSWGGLVVLKASNNMFSGEFPFEFTSFSELTTLLLDGNSLSGEFPSKILSWKSLTTLNLARNKLSGSIPPVIGSLPDLLDLDLSENQFSGQIPYQLGGLGLTSLNLSSNKLSGNIPYEFDNMAFENSFLNNPNLCSSKISNLRSCHASSSSSKRLPPKIIVVIVLLSVLFLASVLFAFYVIKEYRKKKHRRDIATWKLISFHKMDFRGVNILSSLTENNLIGRGGSGKVYQIETGKPGDYIAAKKIWSNRKLEGTLEKEFQAEVQILGSIRHSNIVKLLCCISSDDSNILVYEYMENGSLDKWLHGKLKKTLIPSSLVLPIVLDWPRRLNIAIGAAQGLCYMHHGSSPPIIHRDVKSSNILLDSQFKACVADFGLAKILDKHRADGTQIITDVAGSAGYMAPEYAITSRVSAKTDVYSFGVVLLELVTGREANGGGGDKGLAEWAWKHYKEGKPIVDLLDSEIKEPSCYMDQINTVFKLGLVCTSSLASSRPSMKEVVGILRRCSPLEVSEEKKMGTENVIAPLLGTETYLSSYVKRSVKRYDEMEESFVSNV